MALWGSRFRRSAGFFGRVLIAGFLSAVTAEATILDHYKRLYPRLSDEQRYEKFQETLIDLVARIPDMKPMWDWQRENPDHAVYFAGGRMRGLLRWIELELDRGVTPEQLKTRKAPALTDLSIIDMQVAVGNGTKTDKAASSDKDAGDKKKKKELADRDVFVLTVKGRAEAKALKDTVDRKLGGDWDILPAELYWATTAEPNPTLQDILVGIKVEKGGNPVLGNDGKPRPLVLSPRGGLRHAYEGRLVFAPRDSTQGAKPPVGHAVEHKPEEWRHIFGTTLLRYLRMRGDSPWLKPDVESEKLLKHMASEYEFIPGKQMLPSDIDVGRIQKALDKLYVTVGGDKDVLLAMLDEWNATRLLNNDRFTLPVSLDDLDRRQPITDAYRARPAVAAACPYGGY